MNDATESVIDRAADILQRKVGLRAEPTLRGRLQRCIRDEAAAHGPDLEAYLTSLVTDHATFQNLVNRVTVQESSFFRHPEHFTVLAHAVLPILPLPVTIWSAGCANGQEAYSLAMLLDEEGIRGSVVATDLSTAAVERTAAARYGARELVGLSQERKRRHMNHRGNTWQISKRIRDRVRTLHHNVIGPLPDEIRSCQVVFCRNVLIYFPTRVARDFLERIADILPSDGWLFLGSAETIWSVTDRFEAVRVNDTFIYRPRRVSAAVSRLSEPYIHSQAPNRTDLQSSIRTSATRRTIERDEPVAAGVQKSANSSLLPDRSMPERSVRPPTGDVSLNGNSDLTARAGQDAIEAGDRESAVIAFRKWTYLAPENPIAQLHLGLALEATGDSTSARRAYSAARRVIDHIDAVYVESALKGYSKDEVLKLLDAKQQVLES